MNKNIGLFVCLILILLLAGTASAADKVYFYHTDPAGTPVAMSNDTGAIVWKATYKPFGEEHSINPATIENNERFAGKEKDKETGLQYFGARYLKDKIGRFLSPDPVGPVDPRNGKINQTMLSNPQRLNPYAYALNNPYRFIDPDGKWAEDVHSGVGRTYGTYTWAKQAGFSDKQARIIANGNNRTDGGPYSSFLPLTGDQSRHFNQSGAGDTRDYWANVEFDRAVKYAKDGDMKAALGHLGKGLHSLQDKFAHRDWETGPLGKERHPDWYDEWSNPKNAGAAENTRNASINYLKSFNEKITKDDR